MYYYARVCVFVYRSVHAPYTIFFSFDFKSGVDFFPSPSSIVSLYAIIKITIRIIKKCVRTFRATGVHDPDERLLIRTRHTCVILYYMFYIPCTVFHVYLHTKSGQGFQNPLRRCRRRWRRLRRR